MARISHALLIRLSLFQRPVRSIQALRTAKSLAFMEQKLKANVLAKLLEKLCTVALQTSAVANKVKFHVAIIQTASELI